MTDTIDPRAITDAERPWLGYLDTLPKLEELRRRLIDEASQSSPVAAGIVTYLNAMKHGSIDDIPSETRRRYRRILEQLGPPTPPKKGRRKKEAGYAQPQVMPMVAGAIGMAAAAPHSIVASGVVAAVALYVTRTPGDEASIEGATTTTSTNVVDLCAHRERVDTVDVLANCA